MNELDPGEHWAVLPKKIECNQQLWSPGLKRDLTSDATDSKIVRRTTGRCNEEENSQAHGEAGAVDVDFVVLSEQRSQGH